MDGCTDQRMDGPMDGQWFWYRCNRRIWKWWFSNKFCNFYKIVQIPPAGLWTPPAGPQTPSAGPLSSGGKGGGQWTDGRTKKMDGWMDDRTPLDSVPQLMATSSHIGSPRFYRWFTIFESYQSHGKKQICTEKKSPITSCNPKINCWLNNILGYTKFAFNKFVYMK